MRTECLARGVAQSSDITQSGSFSHSTNTGIQRGQRKWPGQGGLSTLHVPGIGLGAGRAVKATAPCLATEQLGPRLAPPRGGLSIHTGWLRHHPRVPGEDSETRSGTCLPLTLLGSTAPPVHAQNQVRAWRFTAPSAPLHQQQGSPNDSPSSLLRGFSNPSSPSRVQLLLDSPSTPGQHSSTALVSNLNGPTKPETGEERGCPGG